jgi:cytosine deaminase
VLDLVLRNCRLPERGDPVDLAIADGRIVAVGSPAGPARETFDLDGRLVTPGLVEAHIHLDKALLADRVSGSAGTAAEAIRLTGQAKRGFTAADIAARARRVLDMAVAAGTTAMRAHVEIDPIIGLTGMEAMLALEREYAPAVDIQLCAFAQEGILQAPGTETLLRRALEMGADVVGGCPYNDTDAARHIEIVFALAREFAVDADFPRRFLRRARAPSRARDHPSDRAPGLADARRGRPSHRDGRAAARRAGGADGRAGPGRDRRDQPSLDRPLSDGTRRRAERAARARADPPSARGRRPGRARVQQHPEPFTPIGTADPAHLAFVAAVAAHMGTPELMRELVAAVTTYAARILNLRDYGCAAGCRADLVVWDCRRPEEIVTSLPARRLVLKAGRISVEHERRVVERWRSGNAHKDHTRIDTAGGRHVE